MKRAQRVLAALLAVALLLPCVPAATQAAGPTYVRANSGIPFITAAMRGNSEFFKQFLATTGGANFVGSTTKGKSHNVNNTAAFQYGTKYMHKENDDDDIGWYTTYYYNYSNNAVARDLIESGTIDLFVQADLTVDDHRNAKRHWGKKTDRARVQVFQRTGNGNSSRSLLNLQSKGSDPDEKAVTYDGATTISKTGSYHVLEFKFSSMDCECGSSAVSKVIAAAIDTSAPSVTNGFISSDEAGTATTKTAFKAGEYGYVQIDFSEPIRFANAQPTDMSIQLSLYNAVTQSSLTQTLTANLVRLEGKRLTFKFQVPETVGGNATNVYIGGIGAAQTDLRASSAIYDLVAVNASGNSLGGSFKSNEEGVNRTRSRVTDLAGNAVTWAGWNFKSRTYLDAVNPTVSEVKLSLTDHSNALIAETKDMSRSATYGGIGDEVSLSVVMSEKMTVEGLNLNSITATLNVKNGNTPVTLTAKSTMEYKNGVNGAQVTEIIFGTIKLTDGMVCSGANGRVAVESLQLPNSFADAAGNKANLSVIPASSGQVFLDVTSPVIDGALTQSSQSNSKRFYFPIRITDTPAGVTGLMAYFAWVDTSADELSDELKANFAADNAGKPFSYGFSNSASFAPSTWYDGTISADGAPIYNTMPVTGTIHLWIQLKDSVDYNIYGSEIVAKATDWAGNGSEEVVMPVEGFTTDAVPPVVTELDSYMTLTANEGYLTARFSVVDPGGAAYLHYQWSDGVVQKYYLRGGASTETTLRSPVIAGAGELTLTYWAEDVNGNLTSEKTATYTYNLTLPAANLAEEQRDPKDMTILGPSLNIDYPEDLNEGDGKPVTTTIMVKNPFGGKNDYFIYPLTSEVSGDRLLGDFFEQYRGGEDNLSGWYAATVTRQETGKVLTGYEISGLEPLTGTIGSGNAPATPYEQFIAMFGYEHTDKPDWHFYGELTVELCTINGDYTIDDTALEGTPDYSYEMNTQVTFASFTMRSADAAYLNKYEHYMIGNADSTVPARPDIEGHRPQDSYDIDPSKEPATFTLADVDGMQIPLRFFNVPAWGNEDIDTSESKLTLYYTGNEIDYDGSTFSYRESGAISLSSLTKVYETPLMANLEGQVFAISVNEDNRDKFETGFYVLVASVVTKSKDTTDAPYTRESLVTSELFIDCYTPDAAVILNHVKGTYPETDAVYKLEYNATNEWEELTTPLVVPVGDDFDWVFLPGTGNTPRDEEIYYASSANKGNTHTPSNGLWINDVNLKGGLWFRAWNADIASGEADAPWLHVSKNFELVFVTEAEAASFSGADYGTGDTAYIPVIYGQSNAISYEFCSHNGASGGVQQMTLLAAEKEKRPTFDLERSDERETGIVPSVLVKPMNIQSDADIVEFVANGENTEYKAQRIENEGAYPYYELTANGTFTFYMVDEYGMVGKKSIITDRIDGVAPDVVGAEKGTHEDEENLFTLEFLVNDNYPLEDGYLELNFTGKYATLLPGYIPYDKLPEGGTSGSPTSTSTSTSTSSGSGEDEPNGSVIVRIPFDETKLSLEDLRSAGIYDVDYEVNGGSVTITLELVTLPLPDEYYHYLEYAVCDAVGNYDRQYQMYGYGSYMGFSAHEVDIEYSRARWSNEAHSVVLDFTAPVKMVSPNAGADYSMSQSVPIMENGTYTIIYLDTFGRETTEEITVTLPELNDLVMDVTYSTTAPTRATVESPLVLTLSTFKENIYLTKYQVVGSGTVVDLTPYTSVQSFNFTENTQLLVTIENAVTKASRVQLISVTNIDNEIHTPEIFWHYDGSIDGEITDGAVTVSISGDETLIPTNGTDLSHTFTNGTVKGATYTFHYADEAGNTGSLTASLPCGIQYAEPDVTPPEVNAALMVKTSHIFQQVEAYRNEAADLVAITVDSASNRGQGFRIDLKINDTSPVKVIVKKTATAPGYSSASDTISGISVSGTTVQISSPADMTTEPFYLFVVDNAGNYVSYSVPALSIDVTSPKGEVVVVPFGLYSARATLTIDPADVADTIVTNRTGVTKAAEGSYTYDFTKNETFYFNYEDGVGNQTATPATATSIDMSPPEVIKLWWTPADDPTDERPIVEPPTTPTNRRVAAQLTFRNPISNVVMSVTPVGHADAACVTMSFTDRIIDLVYTNNAQVTLTIDSPNGRTASYTLPSVRCIDLEVPTFDVNKATASTKRSVNFYVKPSEDVYFVEGAVEVTEQDGMIYVLRAVGEKTLHFQDVAGNRGSALLEVLATDLSTEPLAVLYNTTADDSGAVDALSKLSLVYGTDTVYYIKASRPVTVEVNGTEIGAGLAADIWHAVTLATSGVHELRLTDDRDEQVVAFAVISMPDKTPPRISLGNTTVSIPANSSAGDLKTLIDGNITVTDVHEKQPQTCTVDVTYDAVDLTARGYYIVTITATDPADNISTDTMTVRVTEPGDLSVVIDNIAYEPKNTYLLYSDTLELALLGQDGLEIDEPYTIYVRPGYKTPGQMKAGSEKYLDETSIPFSGDGYYTVYIQTQSRHEFILYVYVMG